MNFSKPSTGLRKIRKRAGDIRDQDLTLDLDHDLCQGLGQDHDQDP